MSLTRKEGLAAQKADTHVLLAGQQVITKLLQSLLVQPIWLICSCCADTSQWRHPKVEQYKAQWICNACWNKPLPPSLLTDA